ncbi:MAG: DUF6359 domain-containing protein [Paludibacteraceae bacterium]|nr:DUF6359 domain-containing protein [Paludibacteraceae bacterium]
MKISKLFFSVLFVAATAMAFTACEKGGGEEPFPGGGEDPVVPAGDRDGSEAKPYNVQDLLGMKTGGTLADKDAGTVKSWVEAYIVGAYNFDANPQWIIGTENAVATNVLLADAADATDTYAVATVKLGDYGSVLNLVNNPTNLGKKLKLYGIIEKYCGVGGVVKLEKVYMDGTLVDLPGEDDCEVNDNMTVAEAFAAAASLKSGVVSSQQAGIVGYVSMIKIEYSEQYSNVSFYMSDDPTKTTGADGQDLLAFRVQGDAAATVKAGDKVKVTANLINYKGNTPETNAGGTFVLVD